MDISKLCYELYKIDWESKHGITAERKSDAVIDYYEGLTDDDDGMYTFDDYINDFGYSGELYVSFGEFLDYEYRDSDYMHKLLKHLKLIKLYDEDREE